MSHYKLRRCAVCKRWGASFLVQESDSQKSYYCYDCWKIRFASQSQQPDTHKPSE